jgi:hypothetical protein
VESVKTAVVFFLAAAALAAPKKATVPGGTVYFTALLGHVHQAPSRPSPSLTTIQCGHPLREVSDPKVVVGGEWAHVQVADHRGFVWRRHLSGKRPNCFQARHPKFFDALQLDLAELYYWGRLYDHWEEGEVGP